MNNSVKINNLTKKKKKLKHSKTILELFDSNPLNIIKIITVVNNEKNKMV